MNVYRIEKSPALDQPWSEVGKVASSCFTNAVCLAKNRDNTGARYWRAKLISNVTGVMLGRVKVFAVERDKRGQWRAVQVPA